MAAVTNFSTDAAISYRSLMFLVLFLTPGLTFAQETQQFFSGEAGYGSIAEDDFVTTRLDYGLQTEVDAVACPVETPNCQTRFGLALTAPLRLRVVDRDPQDAPVVREEDWDEPSDYTRFLRYLEYGRPHEPLHARLGQLGPLSLGHGTIVNGYFNVLTPDRHSAGAHANVNTVYGGLQLMLDDVVAPEIFGARGYVRPWGTRASGFLSGVAFGVSAVTDFAAPVRLEPSSGGTSPGDRPDVAEATSVTVAGLDAEVVVLDTERWEVLPYVDLNVSQGVGGHGGLAAVATFSEDVVVAARAEFRLLGDQYLPDYFGPLYEIGRYQFDGWSTGALTAPKARVAASRRGTTWGGFGELGLELFEWVALTTSFADHVGADNTSLWARLSVTPPLPFHVGAVYYKQNFDAAADLTDLDGALLITEARATVYGPFFVHGAYDRLWRLHDDGQYETIDAWNVGAGAQFGW